MNDFDRYPRIPRRRAAVRNILGALVPVVIAIAGAILIGWMAAEGF